MSANTYEKGYMDEADRSSEAHSNLSEKAHNPGENANSGGQGKWEGAETTLQDMKNKADTDKGCAPKCIPNEKFIEGGPNIEAH